MAAKLQCEICGGKLVGKPGGVFECEYCGMEYDTAWAKEKIQEIKGTVKVEGTVEVKGTVKVEGQASKENLLQRGRMALEDTQWDTAESCYNKILDMDPQCAEAYLGLAIAKRKYRKKEDLVLFLTNPNPRWLPLQERDEYWQAADLFRRAESLADGSLREYLENIRKEAEPQLEAQRQAKAAEQAAKDKRERRIPLLMARRAEVEPAKRLLRQRNGHMYVLMPEGKIQPADEDSANPKYDDAMKEWSDIQKFEFVRNSDIDIYYGNVLILDVYGNVNLMVLRKVEVNDGNPRSAVYYFDREELVTDSSAVDICDTWKNTYVLMENGTLECWEKKSYFNGRYFRHWNVADNVKEIHGSESFVCCQFADGKRKILYDEGEPTVLLEENDRLLSNPGVCIDGTLVKDHNRYKPELEWKTVIDWAAHYGLMMDGTVYRSTEQRCETVWQNVAAIKWGGIKNDSVYAITNDGYLLNSDPEKRITVKQPLFESLEALKKSQTRYTSAAERRKALEDLEKQKQQEKLESEKAVLQTELSNLKGLFTGKRRKEIETRLAEIDRELKELS